MSWAAGAEQPNSSQSHQPEQTVLHASRGAGVVRAGCELPPTHFRGHQPTVTRPPASLLLNTKGMTAIN